MKALLLVLLLFGATAACSNGCTPSASQPVVLSPLTSDDSACVTSELDGMVIPAGTPIGIVAGDVTIGCKLDNSKTPAVATVATAYVAAKAEAGAQAPAGMLYRPGPRALEVLFDGGGK